MTTLAVAMGGAPGAVGRYAVERAAQRTIGPRRPWGILVVNVVAHVVGALSAAALGLAITGAL